MLKLCRWGRVDLEACIQTYCRWIPRYDGTEVLALKEKDNYDCILWNDGCMAYEERPVQCVAFPFWDSLLASRKTWNAAGRDCPGINQGKVHDAAAIQALRDKYAWNKPVRRPET
jgi:Fe-S-cluster containining protein